MEMQKETYVHVKTGNQYTLEYSFGIKALRKWFYFFVYRDKQTPMYFIRTQKDFLKKFSKVIDLTHNYDRRW